MFERTFPVTGLQPVEALHILLARFRDVDRANNVSLGSPPFERDELNRIKAVRLRFTPRSVQ